MRTFILILVLLIASAAYAELKSYMRIEGETLADAIDQAEQGFQYLKSQGARITQIDTSSARSNRRRKKDIFPSFMNGYYLTPENELLEIRKGKLENRLQIVVSGTRP